MTHEKVLKLPSIISAKTDTMQYYYHIHSNKCKNKIGFTKKEHVVKYWLLYTALIWSSKFRFTALLEGICATLNLHIQAPKLYIYYYIDIYLKDVILVLSWGAKK